MATSPDKPALQRRPQPGKRLLDLCIAVPTFLVLLPIMFVTAVAIALFLGWPVFFRQRRPGLLGRPFEMVKFRSMTVARNADAHLQGAADRHRLTRLGRFVRKTSLDELPQLWNVIRGDMSLVGPRPLFMEYLPHYSAEHLRRHEVRPGITGWAQVNGRNETKFSERFKLDLYYVDHWSLGLDFRILALTLLRVVRSSGVQNAQPTEDVDDLHLHPESRRKAGLPVLSI